jgi:ribonuclease HII
MELGSDEAGKGPVLGPMVVAAVATTDQSVLPQGLADSKELEPDRRRELAAELEAADRVSVGVQVIGVERIDDPETDMNSLTVSGHAAAIDDAAAKRNRDTTETEPVTGLADAGDTSAKRFERRVTEACELSIDLDARHGADGEDAVVAAASIVAKVRRDERIARLDGQYEADIGSGYPSDPTTRQFLESYAAEHGTVPPCARRSWATCDDVLASVEQSGLEEF